MRCFLVLLWNLLLLLVVWVIMLLVTNPGRVPLPLHWSAAAHKATSDTEGM